MRNVLLALGLIAAVPLAACSKSAETPSGERTAAASAATDTLPDALGAAANMKSIGTALTSTGLSGIFDGKGSYTVIAPTDAAFAKLGDAGTALMQPEQKSALAAALREHIVPGELTLVDIGRAIDMAGDKAVKMRTMGSGDLTFRKAGDAIQVTSADGASATLAGPEIRGKGSVAIPADTVLRKL